MPSRNIVFHGRADSVIDEDIGTSAGSRFQERLTKVVRAFETHKDSRTFIHRVNLDILRQMCKDRGLPETGQKRNLLTELEKWVSRILHNDYTYPQFVQTWTFSVRVPYLDLRLLKPGQAAERSSDVT